MYGNVGLTTAKGSGTSGFVQRNLSTLSKHQKSGAVRSSVFGEEKRIVAPPKQLSAELLEHNRKRAVEVKVAELEDELREKKYVSIPCNSSHFALS